MEHDSGLAGFSVAIRSQRFGDIHALPTERRESEAARVNDKYHFRVFGLKEVSGQNIAECTGKTADHIHRSSDCPSVAFAYIRARRPGRRHGKVITEKDET